MCAKVKGEQKPDVTQVYDLACSVSSSYDFRSLDWSQGIISYWCCRILKALFFSLRRSPSGGSVNYHPHIHPTAECTEWRKWPVPLSLTLNVCLCLNMRQILQLMLGIMILSSRTLLLNETTVDFTQLCSGQHCQLLFSPFSPCPEDWLYQASKIKWFSLTFNV